MSLHIRQATNLSRAIQDIRQCANDARNTANASTGFKGQPHLSRYLAWVNNAEIHLGNHFTDPAILGAPRGGVFWQIQHMGISHPFLPGAINTELRSQADRLDDLAGSLAKLKDRIDTAPGIPTLPDTNVLLHYEPPVQVNWLDVIGAAQVRLILPLRVIEELDEKKYLGRHDIADRARRLISQLWPLLVPTGGAPVEFRPHVTIELPIETGVRLRPLDADQEVLDTCEELQAVGQAVVLVTGDAGMGIRATGRGLTVRRMPDRYLRAKQQPPLPAT